MAGGYYAGWHQGKGRVSYGHSRHRSPNNTYGKKPPHFQGTYTVCSCGKWIYDDKKSQARYCSGCGKPWAGPGAQGKAQEAMPPQAQELLDRVLAALPGSFRTVLYEKFPDLSPKPGHDQLRKAADAAYKEHKQAAERKSQMEKKKARLQRELDEAESQLDSATKESQEKTEEYKRKWALYERELAGADTAEKKPTPEGAGTGDKGPGPAATASTAAGSEDASMGVEQPTGATEEKEGEEEKNPDFVAFMADLEPGKRALLEQHIDSTVKRQRVKGSDMAEAANIFKEGLGKQFGGMGAPAAGGQQQG